MIFCVLGIIAAGFAIYGGLVIAVVVACFGSCDPDAPVTFALWLTPGLLYLAACFRMTWLHFRKRPATRWESTVYALMAIPFLVMFVPLLGDAKLALTINGWLWLGMLLAGLNTLVMAYITSRKFQTPA